MIAYDAASETTNTANPTDHTHTPVGTPRAIAVFITHGTVSTDIVNGVTYGGVAMTRELSTRDSTGEVGRCYGYKLTSGIPTGAQTVSVDRTEATTPIHVVAVSMTADTDTEVVHSAGTDGDAGNLTNPAVTLLYAARNCLGLVGLYSGAQGPANLGDLSAQTRVHDHDFGDWSSAVSRATAVAPSDNTMGYVANVNAAALVAMAFSESVEDAPVIVTSGGGSSAPRSPAFLAAALRACKDAGDLVRVLTRELPRFAQAVVCYERVAHLPYGTTVRPSGRVSRAHLVTVTDTAGWAMAAPTESREGVELTFDIWNASTGTMGTVTWADAYELTESFTNPADTKHRLITFVRMPDSKWRETRRSASDLG